MSIGILMALIIIAIIFALSLKARNPEISSIISVGLCLVIISVCVDRLNVIISKVKSISSNVDIDKTYIFILLKLIGIAYICEFASGISKDAGYSAVASQIELLGKLTMLMVSLPVLEQVIEIIINMMR
ncbi:MAG: stage III sporulation protein AD [Lachnospiraceae bacterium]|nr:stage III sporulation protein AD [Lachnospiraceae bacterium]